MDLPRRKADGDCVGPECPNIEALRKSGLFQ